MNPAGQARCLQSKCAPGPPSLLQPRPRLAEGRPLWWQEGGVDARGPQSAAARGAGHLPKLKKRCRSGRAAAPLGAHASAKRVHGACLPIHGRRGLVVAARMPTSGRGDCASGRQQDRQ
eukprot:3766648-Heterocapsa_arctica.AAC.1